MTESPRRERRLGFHTENTQRFPHPGAPEEALSAPDGDDLHGLAFHTRADFGCVEFKARVDPNR